MRHFIQFMCSFFLLLNANGQSSIDQALKWYNKESVPYISVAEVQNLSDQVILDARELEEFKVSHLKNAVWIGYDDFELEKVVKNYPDKKLNFVVYCSIGVRSENIGEELVEAGYLNTKNLYGGIFEWTNQGYPVYNAQGKETNKVHAYGKLWGKFVTKAEKVYQD